MNYIQSSQFGVEKDKELMQEALKEAQKAFNKDEVPVGAVLVDDKGVIVGRGYNNIEKQYTQRAHAEMIVIEMVSNKIKNWRLVGFWLYVTLEPCMMCISFIRLSRLAGVVYGAASPLFGFHLDNQDTLRVYKKDALRIVVGVEANKAGRLLKLFFIKKRNMIVDNSNQNVGTVKQLLMERKRELEEKLAEMAKEKFSDDQVQDPGDQVISSTMELLRMSFQSTEIGEYKRIVRALEKIEEGTYGICVDCEKQIPQKRLDSFPNAERCLVCQEAFEDRPAL